MRAMVIDRFGGPEMLREARIERPIATPGTVVVRVAYCGVNPADWKVREGWLSRYFDYCFPFVPGFDAAGVVADVRDGDSPFRIGDRVVTASNQGKGERGTYAEYVVSDFDRVARLQDNVSLMDAAALPTAGITAHEAVLDVGGAAAGMRVLVHGGAGGTGGYAIQLARIAGAHVATSCNRATPLMSVAWAPNISSTIIRKMSSPQPEAGRLTEWIWSSTRWDREH